MPKLWIAFWGVVIFGSIAWYGFLLFYIGVKAWFEIGQMVRAIQAKAISTKSKGS